MHLWPVLIRSERLPVKGNAIYSGYWLVFNFFHIIFLQIQHSETPLLNTVAEIQFRMRRGEASRISDKFVLIFHSFWFF